MYEYDLSRLNWPLTAASLPPLACPPPSLSQSLLRSVQAHFLLEQQATNKLHPLTASLAAAERALGHLLVKLDTAMQHNNRTHMLLKDTHSVLHTFQVTCIHIHAHTHTHFGGGNTNDDVLCDSRSDTM